MNRVCMLVICLIPVMISPGWADLVFDKKEFVYKAMPIEDEFKATFAYENTGKKTINITKIDTFCGCLDASVTKGVVKPGEKGVLTGRFEIGKLTGKLTKQIEVTTDLSKNPVKSLDVTVDIPELFNITPEKGVVWNIGDKPAPKSFHIKVVAKDPIHVKSVEVSRDNVAHRLKTIKKGREYEVILQPLSTNDVIIGFLKIQTDCKVKKHQTQMAFFSIVKKKTAK